MSFERQPSKIFTFIAPSPNGEGVFFLRISKGQVRITHPSCMKFLLLLSLYSLLLWAASCVVLPAFLLDLVSYVMAFCCLHWMPLNHGKEAIVLWERALISR